MEIFSRTESGKVVVEYGFDGPGARCMQSILAQAHSIKQETETGISILDLRTT